MLTAWYNSGYATGRYNAILELTKAANLQQAHVNE